MKHFYLKSLFAGLLLLVASNSFAYDFEVDGIYYNILSEEEKTVAITKDNSYSSLTGTLTIPENVNYKNYTYTVTRIEKNAFLGANMKSVVLPNTITDIGGQSFACCRNLESITIPNSVTRLRGSAFFECYKLESITIPNSIRAIEGAIFEHCRNLKHVYLPNSVTKIEKRAFNDCRNLQSINIPESVDYIGDEAFEDCSSLTSISIPSSVTAIHDYTFSGCTNLIEIYLPASITTIGEQAFRRCNSLYSVTLPSSITEIGECAFSDCISLSTITIPNSVKAIEESTFYNCKKLSSIEIPNTIETIAASAFCFCSELTIISIPNSVKNIGKESFGACQNVKTIHIPNSLTSIDEYAFSGCNSLETVISDIEVPFEISETTFQNYDEDKYVFTDATLYVPIGTKALYESTPGWNLFKNIVEMGLTPVEEDSDEKDFGEDAGIDENTKMDGNIVNNIFYNILEENGFYNPEEGCIVIKKETVDDFLEYIENKNLFSDEVKQQFTGLALMLKSNCQWLKITAEASGNMMLKVKIGNMPPMEMALDGKKTVEFPCSLAEPSLAYIYGSLLPHAGAKGTRRAKAEEAEDELKIYSIAWSEEQEATGIRQTEQQAATDSPTVYNLQGQRVLPTRQGIYVVNGKKLFVK